jgi:hypothetical protein
MLALVPSGFRRITQRGCPSFNQFRYTIQVPYGFSCLADVLQCIPQQCSSYGVLRFNYSILNPIPVTLKCDEIGVAQKHQVWK